MIVEIEVHAQNSDPGTLERLANLAGWKLLSVTRRAGQTNPYSPPNTPSHWWVGRFDTVSDFRLRVVQEAGEALLRGEYEGDGRPKA